MADVISSRAGPIAISERVAGKTFVLTGENTAESKRQANRSGIYADNSQGSAADSAGYAASAYSAARFRDTLSAAITDFAVDEYFNTKDTAVALRDDAGNLTGDTNTLALMRACKRVATSPFYEHLGPGSDPSNRVDFDALNAGLFNDLDGKIIPPDVKAIYTSGYSETGVGRAGFYRYGSTEPDRGPKFQSADGDWWVIDGTIIRLDQLGCVPGPDPVYVGGYYTPDPGEIYRDRVVVEPGTDCAPKVIAAMAQGYRTFLVPPGAWTFSQLPAENRFNLVGMGARYGAQDATVEGVSWILFNGADSADFIISSTAAYNNAGLSHFRVEGCRIHDARAAPTGGHAIAPNAAVNSQIIRENQIGTFPDGAGFLGADTAARAGDNILVERNWVTPGSVSHYVWGLGNFNNTAMFRDHWCDGNGSFLRRILGNPLSGVICVDGLKHEAQAVQSGGVNTLYYTIDLADDDQFHLANIQRRSDNAIGESAIFKHSTRASWNNLQHTLADGTARRDVAHFQDGSFWTNASSGATTHGPTDFVKKTRDITTAGGVRIGFKSATEEYPYVDFYKLAAKRVRLSTYDLSWIEHAIDSAPLLEVRNTSNTSSISARFATLSGGGGAPIQLDRENSDGRFITLQRNSVEMAGVYACTGSPEGSRTAKPGSICMRFDGGALTAFYVKESGTGNTGWVAK